MFKSKFSNPVFLAALVILASAFLAVILVGEKIFPNALSRNFIGGITTLSETATAAPSATVLQITTPTTTTAAQVETTRVLPTRIDAKPIVWARNLNDVVSLDPAEAYALGSWFVIHNLYETLVRFESDDLSTLQPGLATRWETRDAGAQWEIVFTLRDDVKFSSGNGLTSADVVYSFQRALALGKPPSFLWREVGGLTAESIAAPDAQTVVLKLPKTASPSEFLNVLTTPPLAIVDSVQVKNHEAYSDGQSDFGSAWLKKNSAGSAPFLLERWIPNSEILLRANPHARTPPRAALFLIKHVPQASQQLTLLERGGADIVNDLTAEQLTALRANSQFITRRARTLEIFYLGMNAKLKPLADPRVRQAIRHALDYDGIVNAIPSGNAEVLQTFVPMGLPGANRARHFERDVTKSKQLLQDAGYANGFALELHTLKGEPSRVPLEILAAKIQTDLAEIGIRVHVLPQPAAQLLTLYRAQDAPLVLLPWSADYPDANTFAMAFSAYDAGLLAQRNNWQDQTASELAYAAKLETDARNRASLYELLAEYVAQQGPYAILFQTQQPFVTRAEVKGFNWNPMGYADLWVIEK